MKCSKCRYGCREDFEDFEGYRCTIEFIWIEKAVAEDEDLECDLYVEDVDDN